MGEYIIAVFSIRTSTIQFDKLLKKNGVKSLIVETPKSASASCGISVRFDVKNFQKAKEILAHSGIKNFVRFYHVSGLYGSLRISPII